MARVGEVEKYGGKAPVEHLISVTCSSLTDRQPAPQNLDHMRACQDIHEGVQIS